jgi:hypothetical protein
MSAVPLILCADASNALHLRTLIVEAGSLQSGTTAACCWGREE